MSKAVHSGKITITFIKLYSSNQMAGIAPPLSEGMRRMNEYTIKQEVRTRYYTSFFTEKRECVDYDVFLVIAPDGTIEKEFDAENFDYSLDAKIAAQDYAGEQNLVLYKQELATQTAALQAQSEEIARLRQSNATLKEAIAFVVDALEQAPSDSKEVAAKASFVYENLNEWHTVLSDAQESVGDTTESEGES